MGESEELVRRGYDAWNRGDFEAMEQLLAPEFEVDATDRVLNRIATSGWRASGSWPPRCSRSGIPG
jgi:ketosteroid isomerase-like protein